MSIGEVHQLLHKLNVNLPKQKVREMFQVRLGSTKLSHRFPVHDPSSKLPLSFCIFSNLVSLTQHLLTGNVTSLKAKWLKKIILLSYMILLVT